MGLSSRRERYPQLLNEHPYGTMYRTERFKLSTYHDHQTGELYDLTNDPNEHRNLWPEPAYRDIRERLTRESFDRLVFALDLGPPQTARN